MPPELTQRDDSAALAETCASIATVDHSKEDGDFVDSNGEVGSNDIEALSKVPSEPPFTIFNQKTRIFIVFMVAVSALISPFAATLYYPALNPLAQELHVSSSLINFSITTYMICQAIAPAIVASISDTGGRRLSFIICFSIFFIANIGLALQSNYAALLILRMIQASGSSGTIALSIAVVADVATSAQRGKYTGFATAGILLGPAFGPTIGGILAQFLGWRSIFWFLAIFSAIFLILFIFIFPETCRNVVGNGSIPARGVNRSLMGYFILRKMRQSGNEIAEPTARPARKLQLPNPWLTLKILGDKESALLLIYNALAFSGQMVITAALPSMLSKTYHYNELKIGLCFFPVGSGALFASILTGYLMDWNFRRHAKLIGMSISNSRQQDLRGFPLERARVEVIWPYHILTIIFMITFGWVMEFGTNIAGPEILLFCLGFVITGAFNVSNTFLVDLHRESPATATAAVNLTRCLVSAGGVSIIVPLINAIGRGWTFTMIGFLDILLTPALWALVKWGPGWREEKWEMQRRKLEPEGLSNALRSSSDASAKSEKSEKSSAEEV